jgi:hypothetical protein
MKLERLSPFNRDLLIEALADGGLENLLYTDGARMEGGFARERRCFALGEQGWLEFLGWEGAPQAGPNCLSRWALSLEAHALLSQAA